MVVRNKLNSFYNSAKLLVTTGYPRNISYHSEVIDLINPNNSCKSLSDFPVHINGAYGGLLNKTLPIICGGWNVKNSQSHCYIIGQKYVEIDQR